MSGFSHVRLRLHHRQPLKDELPQSDCDKRMLSTVRDRPRPKLAVDKEDDIAQWQMVLVGSSWLGPTHWQQ
jgi:hypothetical protein